MFKNLEEFNSLYAGKPAIIIASGPSVLGVDFSKTKNCVTIAVNSGYVAHKESDFFLSDDWSVVNWSYFFKDLRESTTTPLLYEDKFRDANRVFGDRIVFFRHRKGYHVTDQYSHSDSKNHILQARTSVGSAIHVAHIMGCSPIGLVGVDCCRINNMRYFWQFNPAKYGYPFRRDKSHFDAFRRIMHKGKQSDTDLVDILSYWNDFGSELNKNCKIYNLSPNSVLDVFPKMELNEFLRENYERI